MSAEGIGSRATRAASLRAEMGHPVVDADGHWIETAPVMKLSLIHILTLPTIYPV